MPKRKHDEISSSEGTPNATTARALRLQKLQVNGVLDRSTNSLFRSLKVARGFERQKLGRRQKTAKADSNATTDTARLEAEVTALKSLDLASTAEIHLYKSLLKIKAVASAPALPHHVQATVDALKKPQQVASANVQARLFKSGPVQAAMAEALNGMRAALGIEELKPGSKKRLRAKDYANGNQADDANRPKVPKSEGSAVSKTRAQDEDEWCGLSAPESPENREDHDDDDNDEGVDYKIYAPRLAASSDEESIEEDAEGQNHNRDESNDMYITDESDASPEQTSDIPKSTHPVPIPKRTNPPLNTTTFLPSLSFSGYRSGSDSSPSFSDNDNNAAAAKIQSRKNRMGQQARRALWEKKFGRNANHVRKGARDRDQGWDAGKGAQGVVGGREGGKRGRVDGREGGKRGRGRGRGGFGSGGDAARGGGGGGRFAKRTGANSDPVVARKAKPKTAAEGPLHPSWEAARKVKEQKTAVPFQGKKVVFD